MVFNTYEILKNYLNEGKILIAIDSNVEGTKLPAHLMNSIQVKLNLSYRFNTSVFDIDDVKKEVRIDLGFNGDRFLCIIPFKSIYYVAMADNPLDGVEIVENTPIELLELSYMLELDADRQSELKSKQIDFMASIPTEKAQEIQKRLPTQRKISNSVKEEAFNELLRMLSNEDLRGKFEEVNSLVHKRIEKPSITNPSSKKPSSKNKV